MSIIQWFNRILRRRLDDEDFQDEIRSHLAMAAADRTAGGGDERAARLASLKEFGNVTLTTEAARRVWTPWWIDAVHDQLSDVRYALRTLAKNPVFSIAVVSVLALGIGLNAAVFSMLKGLALTPIAGVPQGARLSVMFAETSTGRQLRVSYPDYQYLRDHDHAFTGLFGTIPFKPNLGRGRGAGPVWGEIVSGNYFEVLGVRAQRGRTLLPSDETAPANRPVMVISDGLWRRDFAADPAIVGRTVEINNYPLTIVGVADPSFHGTTVVYDVEVYVPVTMAAALGPTFGSQQTTPSGILGDPQTTVFYPQGYLRPGVTPASAAAQADALWTALSRDRPLTRAADRLHVVPFWQTPGGAPSVVLPTLGVVTAMGLLVLLIACANIAGLVLVRGLSRRGEIAVRLALGATRTRVLRLLIVENLVLAAPGALFGVLLAKYRIPLVVQYAEGLAAPERLFFNIGVDGPVIAFAAAVACGCAIAFGFVPALQSTRVDLVTVINEDASPRGASRGRVRAGLVVAQVAVSLLLLIGAGLATRSVDAARNAYAGFDPSHTVGLTVDVSQNAYDEAGGRVFYRKLLDAVRADMGTDSVTLGAYTPLGFLDTPVRRIAIDGHEPRRGEDLAFMWNAIGPDYFRTLRIPLLAGRGFDDRDDERGAPVAVVNGTLAQRFFGSAAAAVGKRIRIGDRDWRTVIGVAADVKYARIDEAPRPYFYLPFFQTYRPSMTLYARSSVPIDPLVEQTRAHVAAIDPELPIVAARPLSRMTRGAMLLFDLTATMLFVFGNAGMALAAMGTYGLVSYAVRQGTHEIGIRMALGATGRTVVLAYLARGVRLGAIGAGIGIVVALATSRLLGSLLFGVSATDAVSFMRALAIVLGGVALASIVPAWRASKTNPLAALRHQ